MGRQQMGLRHGGLGAYSEHPLPRVFMSKSLNQRRARHRRRPNPHDPVERVEALTRTARVTWLGLLSYLAFVGVTLMGVQDADFFIKERETTLPLVGVSVPTNLFFYIAPTLGAMLYIHMHLYLLKLWKALGELPSDPDRPVGEKIPPWIVSDMALAQRTGASHAYPLRSLARWMAVLSIFAAGPAVLAAFWWQSMPKHDEVLTILACGVPLFASVLTGWESWRALRRGGAEAWHMPLNTLVGWSIGLAWLSVIGLLITKGGITDRFLKPAQLQGVVFVETPQSWLPYDEAEQAFRREWCADQGIPPLACGPGPLARDDEGDRVEEPEFLPQQRRHWCRTLIDKVSSEKECTAIFAELDEWYQRNWRKARKNAIKALPARVLSGDDLRKADLRGARLEGTNLSEARLEGADLRWARMEGANLDEARLEGADLKHARMERAVLIKARMKVADLRWTRMEEAVLIEAWMEEADLRGARMEGTNLFRARMEGAVLSEEQMEGAKNLDRALLRGAALRFFDYSDVPFTQEQITAMFGDASVTLPEGMDRPAHWPDWKLPSQGDHAFSNQWRKWRDDPEGYVPPPAAAD